jgi:hypothetical protein
MNEIGRPTPLDAHPMPLAARRGRGHGRRELVAPLPHPAAARDAAPRLRPGHPVALRAA